MSTPEKIAEAKHSALDKLAIVGQEFYEATGLQIDRIWFKWIENGAGHPVRVIDVEIGVNDI